ncbi:hypothetical protein B0H13DRAFT_1850830 [Mycena leptocephala]|nr:hypothetical protein B0H13DRAFT_1850830 [Mycena leptocephala]
MHVSEFEFGGAKDSENVVTVFKLRKHHEFGDVVKKIKGGTDADSKPTIATKVSIAGEGTARRPSMTVVPTGAPANANKATNPSEGTARRPSTTVAPTGKTASKVGPSPSKARIARVGSEASPARRPSVLSPRATSNANPTILSPRAENAGKGRVAERAFLAQSSTRGMGKRDSPVPVTEELKSARVGRHLLSSKDAESASRLSTASRARKTSMTESASARPPIVASAARVASESISAKSARSRSGSSVSRPSSSASQRPSVPLVPPLPSNIAGRSALPDSRTPSPDLPSVTGDPATPLPAGKKSVALATPDAKRRIEVDGSHSNGKGKGKTVVFKEGNDENLPEDEMNERERERSISMQIFPRRPLSAGLGHSASWAPSPLRNAVPSSPAGGRWAEGGRRSLVLEPPPPPRKRAKVVKIEDDDGDEVELVEPSSRRHRLSAS